MTKDEEDDEPNCCKKFIDNIIFSCLSGLKSLGLFPKSPLDKLNEKTKFHQKKSVKPQKIVRSESKMTKQLSISHRRK